MRAASTNCPLRQLEFTVANRKIFKKLKMLRKKTTLLFSLLGIGLLGAVRRRRCVRVCESIFSVCAQLYLHISISQYMI